MFGTRGARTLDGRGKAPAPRTKTGVLTAESEPAGRFGWTGVFSGGFGVRFAPEMLTMREG